MLKLSSVAIKNLGPFRRLNLDFTGGTIGLFGKNGAGKSSLLAILQAALSGDWSAFGGSAGAVCENKNKNEAAVLLTGQLGGSPFSIERVLLPKPEVKMTWRNRQWQKSSEVSQVWIDVGLSPAVLDFFVFKKQDHVYDFLSMSTSDRLRAFHAINRTEICEKRWREMGEFLQKPILAVSEAESLGDLENLVNEVKGKIKKLTSDKRRLRKEFTLWKKNRIEMKKVLQQLKTEKRRRQVITEMKEIKSSAVSMLAEFKEVNKKSKLLEKKIEKLEKSLKTFEINIAARQAKVAIRNQRKVAEAERHKWKTQLMELRRTYSALAAVPSNEKIAELRENRDNLVAEIKELMKLKALPQSAHCPTCGAPFSEQLKQKMMSADFTIRSLKIELNQLDAKLLAANQLLEAHTSMQQKIKSSAELLKQAEMRLEGLPEDDGSEEFPVEDLNTLRADLAALRKNFSTSVTRKERLKAKYSFEKKKLAELKEEKSKLKVMPKGLVQRWKDLVAKHKQLSHSKQAYYAASGELVQLQSFLKSSEQQLADAMKREENRRRRLAARKDLEFLRNIFHREELPSAVLRHNLAALELATNLQLEKLGVDFRVKQDDTALLACFPGRQPTSLMSGGQRMILSIAFWSAVSELYANGVGFLALDEPTSNLDGENIERVRGLLRRATDRMCRDRQLLIVTHAIELQEAFDQVINLEEAVNAN